MNHLTLQLDMPPEEGGLLAESARDFFAATEHVRLDGAVGYRESVWREMLGLGWGGWSAPAQAGGSELSHAAGIMLHEEVGAAAAPEPLLEVAVLAAGVLRHSPDAAYSQVLLEAAVTGAVLPCVVWDTALECDADAVSGLVATERSGGAWVLEGQLRFAALPHADCFLVVAQTNHGVAVLKVDRDAPGLEIHVTPRVDGRSWASLRLTHVQVPSDNVVLAPESAQAAWDAVLDEARLAVSAELLGAAAHVLQMTQDYLRIRQQFGRPLAANQVLQHRAVDLAIEVELMRSVVQQAALVWDDKDAGKNARAETASQAKARTSMGALRVIQECIQLHGGIAYTEECSVGRYLKRAMVLAAWLGDAGMHRARRARYAALGQCKASNSGNLPEWLAKMRIWIDANLPDVNRFPAKRQSWREAHDWHVRLHAGGYAAPAWPKEFGGMGLSAYEEVLLHEVYEEFGLNIFQNMGVNMLGPLLQKYGTVQQQEKYLPDVLSGATYWCQGYSEPEAGSDLASLRTQAVLDGEHFIVNGQKIWTSLAHEADMIFLLVRTDSTAKKQQGISFLLLDMKTPGISIQPIVNLTGAQDFCSVFFDNVHVPKECLVGQINEGWSMAKAVLGSERIMIGHPRFAKAALRVLQRLAQTPQGAIFAKEALQMLEAEVADIEALYVRYLNVLREGKSLGAETSVLKICSSECWQKVAAALREWTGLDGTVDAQQTLASGLEVHLPFQFLHAVPSTIYGGTNEIQRNILAAHMLKL